MKTDNDLIVKLNKLAQKYGDKGRFLDLENLFTEELKEFNFKEDDFKLIEEGDWTQDCKCQYKEDIYQYLPTQEYICISNCRTGSPFTDWHYECSHVSLVNKIVKTVVVTKWEVIK